ncbi:MAG: TIGR00282 family metallophosphoesterase [Oscillospiraceae bacterium]|nr:TIGR00282 family metallophosphoesterase [Oscillospiraceae bacterium]
MVVLMLGDVVGDAGCARVRKGLPALREKYGADAVIANGENSAQGNGILPSSAKYLFDSGVDVITTGNHCLRRKEINETLNRQNGVLRPANYHQSAPGSGVFTLDHPRFQLCVINLQGVVFMQQGKSPFDCIDALLDGAGTKNIVVDFHAEATSEKLCMGHYLDGRVSAVLGTHTHIPTADARILPGGTGYQTDIGMCGGFDSVLGIKKAQALYKMRTNLPTRFDNDPEDIRLSGAVLEIDTQTGKCLNIESFCFI